jgi:hypothetical protein
VLIFCKGKHAEALRDGSKRFEIRRGVRYRNIRKGDQFSVNGHFRVQVTAVDVHLSFDSVIQTGLVSRSDLEECYPETAGPFYVFTVTRDFTPQEAAQLPLNP